MTLFHSIEDCKPFHHFLDQANKANFFHSSNRSDKEFAVHIVVDGKRREEQYYRCVPSGRVAT